MLLNFGPPCNEMLSKLVDLKYIRYEIVNCRIQLSIWYLHSQSYRLFFMKNTLYICLLPLLHADDLYNLTHSLRQSSNENSVFLLPKSDAPQPTICLFLDFVCVNRKIRLIWIHYRRPALCRVPGGLPSVIFRALGKDVFAECFFLTLGK